MIEFTKKINEMIDEHALIVEEEIKNAMGFYMVSCDKIVLKVSPSMKYEILIKAQEFEIKHSFVLNGVNIINDD